MPANPLQPYPTTPQPRIVSLLPSATEIVALLGASDLLVGRSHECDFPIPIFSLPTLTAPRTHAQTPAEIDRQVRESVHARQPLYSLDEDLLASLQPDLILTQDLCDVCSIDLASVQRVADRLHPSPEILNLHPTTVEDVLDDLLRIALAIRREPEGKRAVGRLRERLFAAAEFVNAYVDGPSVAFLEWTDPLFCAGHWTVQLIERAGGWHPLNPTTPKPTAGAAAGPQMAERIAGKSIRLPPEVLVATRPEYLIICPCGLDLDAARAAAVELASQNWFPELPAVRNRRVAIVDGRQMFNRPGPRLVDAFEWLVAWLNGRPELIPPNFPWEPLHLG
jgi:ABC-type Fe3+-hydroxamate transport system substrate-binding protein